MLVELTNHRYTDKKFKEIIKKNKKHIKIIDLKNNNISILPDLDNLINLEELYLEDNNLKILPKLNNKLVYLYISSNEIKIIPESIKDLNKLEYLDISCNPIENLEIIFQIPILTYLNISNNLLTNNSFKNIHLLINLHNLNISNNNLTKIPKEIFKLKNLKYLDISFNKIIEISFDIRKLKNLLNIYIDINPIKNIPITIKKYLTSISVDYIFYKEKLAIKYKNIRF